MSERAAVIVIGAGIGGLAAAAYTARQGLHTLVLEAGKHLREPAEALMALDPRMMSELQLAARGFRLSDRRSAFGGGGRDVFAPGTRPSRRELRAGQIQRCRCAGLALL